MPRIDQRRFYENAYRRHGVTARGVAWRDERRQSRRFDQLLRAIPSLSNVSVVDLGCGFGDLWVHMERTGRIPKRYTGVDLLETMVMIARKRTGCTVLQRDMLKDPLPEADWYIASGTFNLLTRFETIFALKRIFEVAHKGIVFNLLKGRERRGTFNYWLPREIRSICASFGRVQIYTDYLEDDFTVRITL